MDLGQLDMHLKKMKLDSYYIQNHSLNFIQINFINKFFPLMHL